MGWRIWCKSTGALVAVLGLAVLTAGVAGAQTAPGPSIAVYTQLVDDTHFSATTVAPNPSGTYLAPLSAVVDGMGRTHVFAEGGNQHLFEFHQTGTIWSTPADLTGTTTGAPTISSPPTAFFDGTSIDVFALSSSGNLIMYQNNGAASTWTTTDINDFVAPGTFSTTHVTRVDPEVISGVIHLYGQSLSGDLVEIDHDNVNGHAWNIYDETLSAGGGSSIAGGPASLLIASVPHVYARAAQSGHLVEFVADHLNGNIWNEYDTTIQVSGSPPIAGNPHPVILNGVPHVYTISAANGDLVELVADHLNSSIWNGYDQTASNGAPVPVGNISVVLSSGAPYGIAQPVPEVWETAPNGELTVLVADHKSGSIWHVYDVTALSAGPRVSGDATPIAKTGTTGNTVVQVFASGL